MREILARSDNDFLFSEPKRKSRSRPPNRPRHSLVRFFQLLQRVAAYPERITGAVIAVLVIAISVNALELQQTRHPAPLFHKSFVASAVPPLRPRPRHVSAVAPPYDPIGQWLHSKPQDKQPATAGKQADPDLIGRLLQTGGAPTAPQASKTIFAVQHALVKLGFVLKPDGIEGDATRRAIEQFESDHGLPARGELSPRVLQELRTRSGIDIE